MRSLLSSYYTAADGAGSAPTARAAASIDSAAFDADAYTTAFLRKARLDQLHVKYNDMAREIRSLDSDMQARAALQPLVSVLLMRGPHQMLVYENYSKFITATDTIRTMKSTVEEARGAAASPPPPLRTRRRPTPAPRPRRRWAAGWWSCRPRSRLRRGLRST